MLVSPDGRLIISNLGWVDRSSLWTYDVVKDQIALYSLGNSKYLSLHTCKDDNYFAVYHHTDNYHIRITIHSFDSVADPLCSIEYSEQSTKVEGNTEFLKIAPHYFIGYYDPGYKYDPVNHADYYLISIYAFNRTIEINRFEWYDDFYDKGYQAIIGVFELDSGNIIVSVQRDSNPILYDPSSKTIIRKLDLAGRNGNKVFRYAKQRGEIWADDYDTILKLNCDNLSIISSRLLQKASMGTGKFIGGWSFNHDQTLCLVSRPFKGDAIAISTDTLMTKHIFHTGKQPIDAVFIDDRHIIGRDWKTGSLLKASH